MVCSAGYGLIPYRKSIKPELIKKLVKNYGWHYSIKKE